jgi:multidrug efflux pump subunit AcrA (membrane-fusion protein)
MIDQFFFHQNFKFNGEYKMGTFKVRIIGIVILLFIISACTPAPTGQIVSTEQPSLEVDDKTVSASAEVVPAQSINLSFLQSGEIIEILVETGDMVEPGQVLARIDDRPLAAAIVQAEAGVKRAEFARQQLNDLPDKAAVASAKAALASAEANYDRLDRSGAREIELDAAQAQIDSAEISLNTLQRSANRTQVEAASADVEAANAALFQAQLALEKVEITAPFAGEIIEVYNHTGELAAPGQPVFLLAATSDLRVETTDLSEVDAIRVRQGDSVKVYFDALADIAVDGKVTFIASKASPGSAVNYTTRITLDEIPEGLRWGMSAFVVIQVK